MFKQMADRMLRKAIFALGEDVTYRHQDGGRAKVSGVFTAEGEAVDLETESMVRAYAPRIGVRLADFKTKPRQGDTLEIDGKTFRVNDIEPDGFGGATLWLIEQ